MIPLLAAGIGAGVGLGESIWGGIKAGQANKQMDELEENRPVYSRPDEIKQYLEMAKTGANAQMPGQNILAERNQQSTQGMISKLQESGQLDAGAIQQLYQQELGANNNLAFQQSQYHQGQIDRLSQAFSESAKYADQEFEYNVNAPWQRKYNRAIGKYEAGQSMIGKGISGITGSAYSYLGMKGGEEDQTKGYYGGYTPPATGAYSTPLSSSPSQINTSGMRAIPRI
jgi:hypothetical protein